MQARIVAMVFGAVLAGCVVDTSRLDDDGTSDGDGPSDDGDGPSDDGGPDDDDGSDGGAPGSGAGGAGTGATSGDGAGPSNGGAGGTGGGGCYREAYDPSASLADLASSYQPSAWLETMITALHRRYDNGWFVMDAMQGDPWLTSSFPQYFDLYDWPGLMESVDTACHEETHGFDFDAALSTPGQHVYLMGAQRQIVVPKLDFFSRNEIVPLVTAGGSVTSLYDGTYLYGEQGSYDFIFLADELTAYIAGLACATAVADQLQGGHSYRDGAAAHLLYLELYLRVARTEYPSLYATWQAEPGWQEFVRFAWARGQYWLGAAAGNPVLGIDDGPIIARVSAAENVAEITAFTGDDPATVACAP